MCSFTARASPRAPEETTADGREGFATLFLRAGYPVYLIDQPRRGQAGRSTVPFEMKAAPDGQFWYGQFRIGLWPSKFEGSQFPKGEAALDRFFHQMTPDTGPWDREAIASATAAVFDRSGPGILVTHSAGGGRGWLAAPKTGRIRGIVSYEPGSGFVFPKGEAPEPIENSGYWGAFKPVEVPLEDFMKLTKYPIAIYYGDNIPSEPSARPHQDYWRAAARMAAYLGSCGPGEFGGGELPRPGFACVNYTGHTDWTRSDPPTCTAVSQNDPIASWRTMASRLEAMRRAGIPAKMRLCETAGHGFGLGTGSDAEGWLTGEEAIRKDRGS